MMPFEFATATRIIFGPGSAREIAPAARSMGSRALLLTGRSQERAAATTAQLTKSGIAVATFAGDGEPTIEMIRRAVEFSRLERCDLVIAFGGGSVIDAGKAIAAMLRNPGEIMDYLEVIGSGKPLSAPAAPFVAVPTTAGTGAEVTRNSVLASLEHRVKVSMRSPSMLPRLAIVDPTLTYDLPPAITARTGLDALTQLIEPYVSARANPMTDGFCVEGMTRVSRSLRTAFRDGRDVEAREDMSLAALLGGLSLANAGLGVVHGFAGPFGGMFESPHGAVCAALLPHGMSANLRALRLRAPQSDSLRRFEHVAQILTGTVGAAPEHGIEWVKETCREMNIPPLRTYGVSVADIPQLVEKASKASSMKANPVTLSEKELSEVIESAL